MVLRVAGYSELAKPGSLDSVSLHVDGRNPANKARKRELLAFSVTKGACCSGLLRRMNWQRSATAPPRREMLIG